MRIALVVHEYNRGFGHSRYVVELAERFRARHEVHVFAHRFDSRGAEGITFHRVPAVRATALTTVLSFYASASLQLGRGGGFDIVHAQGLATTGANVITAHICNRSWFRAQRALGHDYTARQRLFERVVVPLEERLYRTSGGATVIAISHRLEEELRELYGRTGPTRVIHHGVDVERFSPALRGDTRREVRAALGVGLEERTALYVGDLRKGAAVTLEALARVPGLTLDLVTRGDTGPTRARAERLGLGARVRFHPPTDAIERFYAAADLFVCPTPYDAFGMVVTEAMAAGLPVIVSRAAGASELITHREDGLLLDEAGDVEALAAAMRELAGDVAFSERLGRAARVRAERCTWDEVARQTLEVYAQVRERRV
ncbi:glycosyltransferase family 4 protein [Archangium sp.]|uniref:glycosyltransferase family 4 protein n=1 Tax=Archangium sp. TaxID=1872627 RepID=UPI002ED98A02